MTINRRPVIKNNVAQFEYYLEDESGKFIRVLTDGELKSVNLQIRENLIKNKDKIAEAMSTGKSLGECIFLENEVNRNT